MTEYSGWSREQTGARPVPGAVEDLQRRAFVMRRVRLAIALLVPVEMALYVPPRTVPSAWHPVSDAALVVGAALVVIAVSAAAHRRVHDVRVLTRWARLEVAADALIALGLLQLFAFDRFSSIWTVLVIVVLEGAFRGGLRGALAVWAGTTVVYTGIQINAAVRYPATAPLDSGSILFRALVVGVVAVVAGQLASALEAAVERHRHSEIALAEQYADLQLIGRVSRAIAAGPEARADVCQAVSELSSAEVVMLYERKGDELQGTAAAGCPVAALPAIGLDDEVSGTVEAFRTARRVHRQIARLPAAVARAADFPPVGATSASFVPVLREGQPIGVLVLAFDSEIGSVPPRVAVALEVLAEEAAVAIARADAAVLLADQARRDPLTGLLNRRGWDETLRTELSRAARAGAALCLLMIDLDGLKAVNDSAGHQAGDELITAAAAAWRERLRPTDVLARYGGDEFAVLLPGCVEEVAGDIAEAVLTTLPPGGSCSVGVAEWDRAEDGQTLVARADAALYQGKRAGGGRVVKAASRLPASADSAQLQRRRA